MPRNVIALMGLALALSGCTKSPSAGGPPPKRKSPAVIAVTEVRAQKELSFVGTVLAPRDAVLSSTRGGRIEAHLVEVGDHVRRGQVVARLGQGELVFATQIAAAGAAQAEARLGEAKAPESAPSVLVAKASLESAEDAARRAEKLHAQGSTSEQDLLRVKNAETAARAEYGVALAAARADLGRLSEMRAAVGQATAALGDKDIRVPFDGVVLQRFLDVGHMAAPHGPLVRIVDPSELHVRFEVPQADADKVTLGAKTRIMVNGARVPASVIRVTPGLVGDANTKVVDARLEGPPKALLPGTRATVWLALPETESLVDIPLAATTSSAGVFRAWVVENGHLSERLLAVASFEGERLLVRRGLRAGDALVTTPEPDFRIDEEVTP